MVRFLGIILAILFLILGLVTCSILWNFIGWYVFPQAAMILSIAALGEHYVSGKGYYSYTSINGYFIGRVPLWIPFMWVFMVQGALLFTLMIGLTDFLAIYFSGIICLLFDFMIVEPYLCAQKKLWQWTPVTGGYFRFVPDRLNRFTAPPGNYVVWFLFPLLLNSTLYVASLLI